MENDSDSISDNERYGAETLRALLRTLPDGARLPDIDSEFNEFLSCMEYFVPAILAEVHTYWQQESLDGFDVLEARKIDALTFELRGLAILITDQSYEPCHLQWQLDEHREQFHWFEFRLGQQGTGAGGLQRLSFEKAQKLLHTQQMNQLHDTHWAYAVGFGERRNMESPATPPPA